MVSGNATRQYKKKAAEAGLIFISVAALLKIQRTICEVKKQMLEYTAVHQKNQNFQTTYQILLISASQRTLLPVFFYLCILQLKSSTTRAFALTIP